MAGTASSVAASESQEAQFAKGWNSEPAATQAGSQATSAAETLAASSAGESQASQPESRVESAASSVASPAATQPASAAASTAASTAAVSAAPASQAASAATSAAVSAEGFPTLEEHKTYEQKWKSQQGTIKSMSATISRQQSELAAERAAKAQSAPASQAASAAASTVDLVDSLEEQYIELVVDGKKADALKLRKQIDGIKEERLRTAMKDSITTEVDTTTTAKLTVTQEQSAVTEIVARTYKAYPFLNNESPEANPDAIDLVRATASGYMSTEGLNRPAALEKALEKAIPIFAPKEGGRPPRDLFAEARIRTSGDEYPLRIWKLFGIVGLGIIGMVIFYKVPNQMKRKTILIIIAIVIGLMILDPPGHEVGGVGFVLDTPRVIQIIGVLIVGGLVYAAVGKDKA